MKQPIPNAALDDRLGFIGTSGSGKTYNAGGATERLIERGARVVIVDPLGVWWGLRLLSDGKTASPYNVAIFGGPHGDLPLNEHAGALIGETAATMAESCIVDLSELKSKSAERRFMTAFLETIYRKANGEPFHLVVDEADLFAPQKPPKGDETLLNLMEQIVRRGRVKGFIPWLISQRPAVLNKNVLSQVDGLVAFKLTASQDRDALDGWIEGQADKAQGKAIKDALPAMQIGQGVVWVPGRGVLDTVAFPPKQTFDSSRTPKRGEKMRRTAALKPLDLGALKDRLATVEAETKANDPKALRARVVELEKQLTQAAKAGKPVDQDQLRQAEQRGFARGEAETRPIWLRRGVEAAVSKIKDVVGAFDAQAFIVKEMHEWKKIGAMRPVPAAVPRPVPTRTPHSPSRANPSTPIANGNGTLSGPLKKIVDAMAWWSALGFDRPTRTQVAFVAGYKPNTGTFNTYMGRLSSGGFVCAPSPGLVELTETGRAAADRPETPTAAELHDRVRAVLDGPLVKITNALIEQHPDDMTRSDLAMASGYQPDTGTFNTYLGRLNSLGVTESPTRGRVVAAPWLFP